MVEKTWEEFGMDEQNRISCNKRAKNGDIKESLRVHMFQDVDTELNSGRMFGIGETSPGKENLIEILDGHEKSVADKGGKRGCCRVAFLYICLRPQTNPRNLSPKKMLIKQLKCRLYLPRLNMIYLLVHNIHNMC